MRYYPLFLDLKGLRVVVIGGGRVAERKVASLIKAGADVTVIGPGFTSRLMLWGGQGKLTLIQRGYQTGDLEKARLAFAATDQPGVNQAAGNEAKGRGIWMNRADAGGQGDFISPALFVKGEIIVAVSSSGTNPSLSRTIRDTIRRQWGAGRFTAPTKGKGENKRRNEKTT